MKITLRNQLLGQTGHTSRATCGSWLCCLGQGRASPLGEGRGPTPGRLAVGVCPLSVELPASTRPLWTLWEGPLPSVPIICPSSSDFCCLWPIRLSEWPTVPRGTVQRSKLGAAKLQQHLPTHYPAYPFNKYLWSKCLCPAPPSKLQGLLRSWERTTGSLPLWNLVSERGGHAMEPHK